MKFRTLASVAAAAGALATPLPATAQDNAVVYQPAGPWAVDYGDDYCRLARKFTHGSDELDVAMERIQPGPAVRLILVSDAIKTFRSATEIGWHFLPSDAERKAHATQGTTPQGPKYVNFGDITLAPFKMPAPGSPPAPPAPYTREGEQATGKTITGLVVDAGVTQPIEIATQSLDAPMAALQACADDLAKTWGLDPAKLKTEKAPAMPVGGGVGWLPQGTVAFTDFAKLGDGSNQVRLMVDATGKPTTCYVHWAALDKATNDKICALLMSNAKFTPATDAAGQPMPGYWIGNPMFMGPPMKGFGR